MKKLFLAGALALFGLSNAQIQEGNWMVGGQVADMKFTNGVNISLTPQVGYFIKDNWAVGGQLGLDIFKAKGASGTQTDWTLGAFTRYYFGPNEIDSLLKNGRFFTQGNVGFGGDNSSSSSSTNGVNLGIGAGYAYFLTPNVSLEGLLGVDTFVGGGSSSGKANVNLGVGFQIYLPNAKAKQVLKDKQ